MAGRRAEGDLSAVARRGEADLATEVNMTAIAVVGTAIHAPRDPKRRSLEEAMYDVGQSALLDAGLTIEDIDGVVVGANDQLDGRAIAIMMASGPLGGVTRDILSTPSAGEHAFVLGALRVATGQFRTQLVAAWSPLEVTSVAEALKLGTDPYFHRALPLDELSAHALQASALEHAVPGARQAAYGVVAKNRAHGVVAYPDRAAAPRERQWIEGGRPIRWPLTDTMVAPPAYGLVALVLADAQFVQERKLGPSAWIHGMGWATEPGFLGDRSLASAPAMAAAARQAYEQAGVKDPASAFQLAEVADATPYQELLAYEGLGLCGRNEWAKAEQGERFAIGGALPVNPSGGALSFNPVYCTGLMRITEAANQVRGRAGNHQRKGVRRALAHAASGFAMQYNTVVVMGDERREVRS
jgi:acetyl-CoA C-acetyltransferase